MVELSGFLYNDAGAPVNTSGCSVSIFPTACNVGATGGTPTSSTDTDACGFWTFSGIADGNYDVRITSGSSVRFVRFDNEQQVCRLEANTLKLGDAQTLIFGASCDVQLRWSNADCTNHAFVLALSNCSQQMHITDVGAIATDWCRGAGTHPELAIHSNICTATDYLAIGNHDGTTATLDVVGGTTLNLDIAGTTSVVIQAGSLAVQAGSLQANTSSAGSSCVNAGVLNLNSTFGGCGGPTIVLQHNSASPADNDTVSAWNFRGNDCGGTSRVVGQYEMRFLDVTSTTMDSEMRFTVMNAVNAGDANAVGRLISTGVWTDCSTAKDKKYEGDATTVWGQRVVDMLPALSVGRYHSIRRPCSDPGTRHISPTAEDLWTLFGVGPDPMTTPGIAAKDLAGIALMAIQELIGEVNDLKARVGP